MDLSLILLCLVVFLQLDFVASKPIQITSNNCNGTDCSIDYVDNSRTINLFTSINDSIVPALPEIIELLGESTNRNKLVSLMENIVTMLSSMMQIQQDNHQQLVNVAQQLQLEGQERPRPSSIPDNLQTSKGPEFLGELQTSPKPVVQISQKQDVHTSQEPDPILQDCSFAPSTGQYSISPGESKPFMVVCDMDTTSGGWIVIQRRFNGFVSFDRNWADYENGFGSLDGEFWLGLSKMHLLTSRGTWKLRFDLEDFNGNRAYAEYDYFQVGDSASFYQLTIRSYSGTAGDAMTGDHSLNGMAFTTKDQDHDQRTHTPNCAIYKSTGWWHKDCAYSLVNGLYLGPRGSTTESMTWYQWRQWNALKKTEMKIKRVE